MPCLPVRWTRAALLALDNASLVTLPPYGAELDPAECVWLSLRERFLPLPVLDHQQAWNAMTVEPGRLRSRCAYLRIEKVASKP